MGRPTRFCRIAWIVEDMNATVAALKMHLGLSMRFGNLAPEIIIAGIDEHGLEPIQLIAQNVSFMADLPAPLVEIALAVDDAEASKALLAEAGILPSVTSPLPGPDTQEYLYGGTKLHGLPIMVCTDGDNESMMAPFKTLEEASPPKVGAVTMAVDSIDKVAADFTRFFGMEFVETDPAGLGARAVVGPHRVKLIEGADRSLSGQHMRSLIAAEMMFDNVEAIKGNLESTGFPVLRTRTFKSGRKGYYFGSTISGLPLAIYPTAEDAEARGLAHYGRKR
jgi:hypothetical protein